jgi:hypothetical protein
VSRVPLVSRVVSPSAAFIVVSGSLYGMIARSGVSRLVVHVVHSRVHINSFS